YESQLSAAIGRLGPLREELKAAIDGDAEAYDAVMKAYKQAKADPGNGDALIEASLKLATGVPLSVAEKAHEVAEITQSLFAVSNPNMKSDLTTAQALAGAAITGALANVEINLASIKDQGFAAEVRKRSVSIKI
ncbi:MAG: cyclodeaminase/cyclohydrolase family protein, partial [Candidatus Sulfotelmatobacter sp.]